MQYGSRREAKYLEWTISRQGHTVGSMDKVPAILRRT